MSAGTVLVSSNGRPSSAAGMVLRVAWSRYLRALETDPVLTKSVSAGVLSVVSDLAAKQLSKDPVRTSSLFNELTMGLVIRGPVLHFFHMFLDRVVFRKVANQSTPVIVVAKTFIDQFLFSPLFVALYFLINGLMQDQSLGAVRQSLKANLLNVMKKNWGVWIPANAIAYAVIPLNLRVLYGNIISIFWTAYLISQVQGSSKPKAVSHANGNGAQKD
ncbi:Peroxisomal membrane protein 2 [Porphyridium purpureum]|uniref:Peroxisomal membrane protein 2 n=1 Tax=Porphyridium purpureum TaxID=35688 RepID=A0A5J4Z5Y3_PORPP|nr:Peroxisomal membrane protein 2 [Porphyridium purpureum]|eukprot:POR2028..scf295_1